MLGNWGGGTKFLGFYRLTNIPVYNGCVATETRIVLGFNYFTIGDVKLKVSLLDVDSADPVFHIDAFGGGPPLGKGSVEYISPDELLALPRTASVPWDITYDAEAESVTSPDLSTIINTIFSRPGWKAGNTILILVEDNGSADGHAFNAHGMYDDDESVWDYESPISYLSIAFPEEDDRITACGSLRLDHLLRVRTGAVKSVAQDGLCGWVGSPLVSPVSSGRDAQAIVDLISPDSDGGIDGGVDAAVASFCANVAGVPEDRGLAWQDAYAVSLLAAVQNTILYHADVVDEWYCAAQTVERGYGDCEDGAILLHSGMLNARCPGDRVKTIFGKVGINDAGHAWVLYRRIYDNEWVVLDWTSSIEYSSITAMPRLLDIRDTYHTVEYALTHVSTHFQAVVSGKNDFVALNNSFWREITINHASGAITLPALALVGQTNISAAGQIDLFKGRLATTMTITGQTGALAEDTLPVLQISGQATTDIVAQGVLVFLLPGTNGSTGAIGAITLPSLSAVGLCGMPAKGAARLPMLAIVATATTEALSAAALRLPVFRIRGTARTCQLASGECGLPRLTIVGHAAQGPVATGAVRLPYLSIVAHASTASEADGVADLPLLQIHAHAVGDTSFDDQLQYKPERWT